MTLRARQRKGLEAGGRDDAKCSLRADVEIAQVVAGVVLAQAAQAVPHLARRQHDLEAQAQLTRVAIAQDLDAAGIGTQIASDRRAAFGREGKRKQAVVRAGGFLHVEQDTAGFGGQRVVGRVNRADALHAPERQEDRAAGVIRGGASHQSRVAALGHDRCARLRAPGDDPGDFLRRRGQDHRLCAPRIASAPVDQVRLDRIDICQYMGGTDNAAQFVHGVHDDAARRLAAIFIGRR